MYSFRREETKGWWHNITSFVYFAGDVVGNKGERRRME